MSMFFNFSSESPTFKQYKLELFYCNAPSEVLTKQQDNLIILKSDVL